MLFSLSGSVRPKRLNSTGPSVSRYEWVDHICHLIYSIVYCYPTSSLKANVGQILKGTNDEDNKKDKLTCNKNICEQKSTGATP